MKLPYIILDKLPEELRRRALEIAKEKRVNDCV